MDDDDGEIASTSTRNEPVHEEETRLARNEVEKEEEDKSIQLSQKIHRSIFPTKKRTR